MAAWLHRLGNLCAVSGGKNPELSNKDFDVKKERLYSQSAIQGYSAGLTAMGLAKIDVWNEEAVKNRQDDYLEMLSVRWGAPSWKSLQASKGKGPNAQHSNSMLAASVT